jgi:hypothetical protein
MEKELVEIFEIRERLIKKEQEVNETIAQSKLVLSLVSNQLLVGDGFNQLEHLLASGEDETKRNIEADGKTSAIALVPVVDSKISQETSPLCEGENSPFPPPLYEQIADLTIKHSKDSLTRKQLSLEEGLRKIKSQQRETVGDESDLMSLENLIEENREVLAGYQAEKATLIESRVALNEELEGLGSKYCEMNAAVNGQSTEDSNLILRSLRKHPSQLDSPSPLLQKYVGILNSLTRTDSEMSSLCLRAEELEIESATRNERVAELKEKLKCQRESNEQFLAQEAEWSREMKECESQIHKFDVTVRGDLIAAMRWAQVESDGLYLPSASTAPVMLLLFQLYCRQQIPFAPLKKSQLGDVITASRLKRYGCLLNGLREAGYGVADLHEAGFTLGEIYRTGFSVLEMRDFGVSAEDMMSLGVPLPDLRIGGYSLQEVRRAGYSLQDIHAAQYSLQDMRDSGVSASEVLAVRPTTTSRRRSSNQFSFGGGTPPRAYSALQLSQVGYSLKELREGGVLAQELKGLRHPAHELREIGYSANELNQAGYPIHEIQAAGYSPQELSDLLTPFGWQAAPVFASAPFGRPN